MLNAIIANTVTLLNGFLTKHGNCIKFTTILAYTFTVELLNINIHGSFSNLLLRHALSNH